MTDNGRKPNPDGRGRPPLPAELRRTICFQIRMTPAEHAAVVAEAERTGMSRTDVVRYGGIPSGWLRDNRPRKPRSDLQPVPAG